MHLRRFLFALGVLAASAPLAVAQPAPNVSEAARAMVGAWELSNSDRDRRCGVTFSVDPAPGGLKLELDPMCPTALPMLKDVVAWAIGQKDVLRLVDSRGVAVFEFTEVESGLYEGERTGEGLYFLQTQAALKPDTRTAEEMFGDWRFLRELGKPLCTLTFAKDKLSEDTFKLIVKPGCDATIAALGLTTWQLDRDQLVLAGRSTLRFTESDPTTWERIPLSTNPLLLMRP
jgi:Protease inhibitor Inh